MNTNKIYNHDEQKALQDLYLTEDLDNLSAPDDNNIPDQTPELQDEL